MSAAPVLHCRLGMCNGHWTWGGDPFRSVAKLVMVLGLKTRFYVRTQRKSVRTDGQMVGDGDEDVYI